MAALTLRPATARDAQAVAAIYNEGVASGDATLDTDVRTPDEVASWLGDAGQPVVVAERDGRLVGFVRVLRSSDRCAQAGVGEYMVYVAGTARGQGVGVRLLEAVVAAAERAGYWKLVGRILAPNAGSRALARRCGFREVGVHERHGRLGGEWKDLVLVERLLGPAIREEEPHGDRAVRLPA